VAVCVLWVRSYFLSDRIGWNRGLPGPHDFQGGLLRSAAGGVCAIFISTTIKDSAEAARFKAERVPFFHTADPEPTYPWVAPPARLRLLGFQTTIDFPATRRREVWAFVVPYWFLAATAAGLPAIRVASAILRGWRRRRHVGLCAACGYDLRATPGRCPECGTVPKTLN
jgi:hypothetical protein